MAAAPAVRFPVFGLVRLLGLAAAAAILFWAVHFRGGMALSTEEESKLPLFNVHPVLMLIGLVALNGEVGCWVLDLLVPRWIKKWPCIFASLACLLWYIHLCSCYRHKCDWTPGEVNLYAERQND
ncbi:putative transmembrane ascorbate ferrireductase 2 [Zea mays]|uniref:Putative transmembrane ascorbate ferrireductase 2 n=1 Tax=Zea mays TaxID=4577 RepID=A0A1D6KQ12_MAIZE|nr:putative transmembrane ascorbate ferrireductase 2 [Zea mays]